MRDTTYISKYVRERGEQNDFSHFMSNLEEEVGKLKKLILASTALDRATVLDTVDTIAEICTLAKASPTHDDLALRIRDAPASLWKSARTLASYLREWLSSASLPIDVISDDSISETIPSAEFVTLAFRVVAELIRNLKKHQRVKKPAVMIQSTGSTTFYVAEPLAFSHLHTVPEWRPYLTVVRSPHGGGTRLIVESTRLSPDLCVEVGTVEVDSKHMMIGRIHRQNTLGEMQ